MLPLAHVAHWYHVVLYALPVIAVLVAIVISARRQKALDARAGAGAPEREDPEA